MPIKMRLSGLMLALLSALPAQAQQANIASRLSDLNYVVTQVPKLDSNFFAHLDPAQFQRAADYLNAGVSTMSDAEFTAGLAHLVAMAGDAHTSLNLSTGPVRLNWRISAPLRPTLLPTTSTASNCGFQRKRHVG